MKTSMPLKQLLEALFFISILVICGVGLTTGGIIQLVRAKTSVNWPTAPGKVVTSWIEEEEDVSDKGEVVIMYTAHIEYEFVAKGKTFKGNRVAYGDYSSNSASHARSILNRYPLGKAVSVYYRPDNPTDCLLEPGLKLQSWAFFGAGLFVSLIAALAINRLLNDLSSPTKWQFTQEKIE
jgi:hypothetical protein